MEQGREVGRLARQLFVGGVEVPFGDPEQAIRITRELIANAEVPAISRRLSRTAVYLCGWISCIVVETAAGVDRGKVHRRPRRSNILTTWRSSTASFSVGARFGFHLPRPRQSELCISGGSIDVWRFFRIKNLTRQVERLQPKLTFQLRSELRVLDDAEPAPKFQLGRIAQIPSGVSSTTDAIRRAQTTTSGTCLDSTLVPPRS